MQNGYTAQLMNDYRKTKVVWENRIFNDVGNGENILLSIDEILL